jgi:hypothetical protein
MTGDVLEGDVLHADDGSFSHNGGAGKTLGVMLGEGCE